MVNMCMMSVRNLSCFKQVLEVMDLLDDPKINGSRVKKFFESYGLYEFELKTLKGDRGLTDFVKIIIPGEKGKSRGGSGPTLGIIGRLGGVGARPDYKGLVSDADGAIVALAAALKLWEMSMRGDKLLGDIIITTHICPNAPVIPHEPAPFVGSPVDMLTILEHEVDPAMDAILSIDATKANRVIKVEGFAITPTVKDGIILKVSDDLINIYERVMGKPAAIVPITMQDITPFNVEVYHINTIMLPWLMTNSPVVGVATTASIPIAGCATSANYVIGLERATAFCVEVAKEFTSGRCSFYDPKEFEILSRIYGDIGMRMREILRGSKEAD